MCFPISRIRLTNYSLIVISKFVPRRSIFSLLFSSRRNQFTRHESAPYLVLNNRILCSSRKRTRIGLQCLSFFFKWKREIFHTPLRAGIMYHY